MHFLKEKTKNFARNMQCVFLFVVFVCSLKSCVIGQNVTVSPAVSSTANGSAATFIPTTPGYTTSRVTPDKCWGMKTWQDGLVATGCTTTICASHTFANFSKFMTCNYEKKGWNDIAEDVYEYASSVATTYTSSLPSSVLGNGSHSFVTDHFLVEVGFLNRQRSDLRLRSSMPHFTQGPAPSYTGKKDTFNIAMLTLNPGVTSYYIVLYNDLITTTTLLRFYYDMPNVVTKLESMGLYKWPTTQPGKWVLNSQVMRIGFTPSPTAMTEPIQITFHHKELMKRINHECITLSGKIDNVRAVWLTSGCHRIYTDRFKTICSCSDPGVYAVISQIEEVSISEKAFSRTFFTIIATAVSIFILLGLLCSILYPVLKGYMHLLRVRIYMFHDTACLMVYFLFIIGVAVSEDTGIADSVAGTIHFFQTAVISWVFVEGLHNYHILNPIYDPEVTSPMFFYSTIGWGIPAALSGACAGYPYNLESAEFSWMKVSGTGMMYFIVGPFASVMAVFVTYGLIFYELRSWIGSKRDYEYRQSVQYFKRSFGFILVAFLTWYSGILARSNSEKLSYSYLFLAMYMIQGAALIYCHFLRNTEIAEYRSKQHRYRPESAAGKTESENLSTNRDGKSDSTSDMKSMISLASSQSSRVGMTRRSSAESDEVYAETRFNGDDEDDDESGRRSRRSSTSSSSSSDSASSGEAGIDKPASKVGTDFSVFCINEDEEEDDDNKTYRQSSLDNMDQEDERRFDFTDEQLQGHGYEEDVGGDGVNYGADEGVDEKEGRESEQEEQGGRLDGYMEGETDQGAEDEERRNEEEEKNGDGGIEGEVVEGAGNEDRINEGYEESQNIDGHEMELPTEQAEGFDVNGEDQGLGEGNEEGNEEGEEKGEEKGEEEGEEKGEEEGEDVTPNQGENGES